MRVSLVCRLICACRSFITLIKTDLQKEDKAQSHAPKIKSKRALPPAVGGFKTNVSWRALSERMLAPPPLP